MSNFRGMNRGSCLRGLLVASLCLRVFGEELARSLEVNQTGGPALGAPVAVNVVRDHKSDWRIVAPPPGSGQETIQLAASEARRYIREMTGCLMPVVNRTISKPAIVLGLRHQLAPADRGLLPVQPAGYDGYVIVVTPGSGRTADRIVVAAETDRAVLYGVYDLLERFGCRWFVPALGANDTELVPKKTDLLLPADSWSVASPLQHRIWLATCGETESLSARISCVDWAAKARFNGISWCSGENVVLNAADLSVDTGKLARELRRRGMAANGVGERSGSPIPPSRWRQSSLWWRSPGEQWTQWGRYQDSPETNAGTNWSSNLSPCLPGLAEARQAALKQSSDTVCVSLTAVDGGWRHGLSGHLAGRCLYDFSLSPFSLLNDFAVSYFGPEAGPYAASYLEETARWGEGGRLGQVAGADRPRALLMELRKRWLAPAIRVAGHEGVFAERVMKLERLHALAEAATGSPTTQTQP